MHFIVGLGNPGAKYKLTRHNVGFLVVDAMLTALSAPPTRSEHKAEVVKLSLDDQPILFAKPQTYMNLSGESVQALIKYYDIKVENMLVIHDDIDQNFGQIRVHKKRGHGGHNGIRDIHAKLDTNDYSRLKIGVGRPENPKQDVASYVLQNFSPQEQAEIPDLINLSIEAIDSFIFQGFDKTANQFNNSAR